MDLFEYNRKKRMEKEAPLAARMRPTSFDEFVGQEHIVGKGRILRRSIEADRLVSMILYGPPGSGKTALAKIIAGSTASNFVQINAVAAGVKEIRSVIIKAKEDLGMYNEGTVLFIDEIHRFNKAQQDALLPHVEDGVLVLVGATTENPYFEVNPPLLSRSRIFRLEPLAKEDIKTIIRWAIADKDRGLGNEKIEITEDALEFLSESSNGDARAALNALELAVLSENRSPSGVIQISLKVAEDCVQRRVIRYDKTGDNHYDVISAFIKSIRGSDPDAALHWLARMLKAGEDPKFICRRMIILASEDIGMADSNALNVAVSASKALDYVGLPEAKLTMAHTAIYLACAPKSNDVIKALDAASKDVLYGEIGPVPPHLRDAHYSGAGKLGHGKGYLYPHDHPGKNIIQEYMPSSLKGKRYYIPTKNKPENST
ncbi:MAG: replication-associated recombination protein A [Clostridia bacterium]|nr:replication-associated recombination protein A [Clostridia bacterium]